MQHAQAFHSFSDACERFVSSIATSRPLSNDEAEIVAYYCKEILAKIEPCLPKPSLPMASIPSEIGLTVSTHHT